MFAEAECDPIFDQLDDLFHLEKRVTHVSYYISVLKTIATPVCVYVNSIHFLAL